MTHPLSPVPSQGSVARALTPAELGQLLAGWNDTARDVPQVTLAELFEAQVIRTPDAAAVVSGDVTFSYTELNIRSNRLARHLVTLGAGPEQLVAVAIPRSADMIVAVLAVLKSGAGYVPVDPGYPPERIGFMVAGTSPVAVLTTAGAGLRLRGGVPRVVLDDPATMAAVSRLAGGDLSDGERHGVPRPSSPAYVIYTSGSTGRPKGVVVEHRSVVSLVCWARAEFGSDELSRVLASTSLSLDVSVFEIFGPLAWGGSIEIVADLLALARARAGDGGQPWQVVRNIYGPTEATVYATAWRAGAADQVPMIGRPVWNTRAFVLDDGLRLVPPGVAGELYLAGAGIPRASRADRGTVRGMPVRRGR